MNDADRFRLRFGPYDPPGCRVGAVLTCAVRGRVKVVGFSPGRIPWPVTAFPTNGARSLIVCGDLRRAVRREIRRAVAYSWGVGVLTVAKWRKALKDPEYRASIVNAKRRQPAICFT
jgi:hypothetical protein